ncbi:MAG: hypothetical protein A2Y40_04765 [Candidatus Margulisbacteria bacterium GWF2_35_9]|nr:MAG: hypothetical protein A2Y40_04765 [Candidatus Margulisbacteria bacterium GWF2_35_9]
MGEALDNIIVEADDTLQDVKLVLADVKKELKRLIVPLLYAKRITPPSKHNIEELKEAVDDVRGVIKDWEDKLKGLLKEAGEK